MGRKAENTEVSSSYSKNVGNPSTQALRTTDKIKNKRIHTLVKKGVMNTKKTSYTRRRLRRITQIYEMMRTYTEHINLRRTFIRITFTVN